MKSSTVSYALSFLLPIISAQYLLQDDYEPSSFASMFDFYTGADPTNGYVDYVDQSTAESAGLYQVSNGTVYMGVDHTNTASGSGRSSIRVTSKNSYNHGLIVLDLNHMPGGQCGSWPAFWMLGPDWPNNGELDIIEGVNSVQTNAMTLHTDSGCSITSSGSFSGALVTSDCDVNAPNQAANEGCSVDTSNTATFGTGFNNQGGGVYATEWTSQAISIWYFPRGAIPADIAAGSPNPSAWGLPLSQFAGACDIDAHVDNMQIVFDTTFCGDWAGSAWSSDSECKGLASTCQEYVQDNPSAFQQTYWDVNSLKVYQNQGGAASTSSTSAVVSTPTATTSATAVSSSSLSTAFSSITSTNAPISSSIPSATSITYASTTATTSDESTTYTYTSVSETSAPPSFSSFSSTPPESSDTTPIPTSNTYTPTSAPVSNTFYSPQTFSTSISANAAPTSTQATWSATNTWTYPAAPSQSWSQSQGQNQGSNNWGQSQGQNQNQNQNQGGFGGRGGNGGYGGGFRS